MLERPDLMLHNAAGEVVKMSGGGHSDMDVFDFSEAFVNDFEKNAVAVLQQLTSYASKWTHVGCTELIDAHFEALHSMCAKLTVYKKCV